MDNQIQLFSRTPDAKRMIQDAVAEWVDLDAMAELERIGQAAAADLAEYLEAWEFTDAMAELERIGQAAAADLAEYLEACEFTAS